MGTHAWIYVKASKLPQQEKDKRVQERIGELKKWWGFNYSHDEVVKQCEKFIKHLDITNTTPEKYADRLLAEYQDYLDDIQKNGWTAWCKQKSGPNRIKRAGEHYVLMYTDEPFRCCIPEKEFYSKQELLDFIHTLPVDSKDIFYWDNDKAVFGVTPELEKRIEELYSTYGEDNIFIDFG